GDRRHVRSGDRPASRPGRRRRLDRGRDAEDRGVRPVDLAGARGQIGAALSDLGSIGDEALPVLWRWREREISRCFGFYRCYELLEEATVGIEARLAPRPEGARIL